MKLEYVLAVIVLLIMGGVACAQDAPPACVGDQCEGADAAPVAESSVVRSRTVYRAYPIAGAPVRVVGRVARGTARVGVAVTRGVVRVAAAPARLVGRVLANGVERRQERRANRRAAGRGLFGCRC